MTTRTLVLLSLLGVSLAAVPLYGQCGGIGYTGDTTCVSGATCVEQNPYYSQCVASGTGTSGSGGGTTTTHTTTASRTTTTTHTTTTTATTTSSASGPTGTQYCGQWDTVAVGTYTLYLDQWGSGGATSGSDCATVSSISGNTIAWSTTWTWVGGTGVKSFTNIQQNSNANKQLSAIKSIQSTWNWSITNSNGIVADVAYDLFTSSTSGGSNQYEIMIWLANYNAGPISYTYSSSGQPTPVASNVSLGGHTWNVYYGSNGSNYVYSFLPTSGVITSFSADLNAFFQYLTTEQTLSSSQYLVTMQAGTEATTGSNVTLKTSAYSLVVS